MDGEQLLEVGEIVLAPMVTFHLPGTLAVTLGSQSD